MLMFIFYSVRTQQRSATADASSIFIPADQPEIFKVSPGEKVAFIGTAEISITEMSA
jgi:hypothetical protein